MILRQLGDTQHSVTRIGLGLAALGRPGYINLGHGGDLDGRRSREGLERHSHTVLSFAYDAGIRYFDAARSYGDGEAFLGRWLAGDDVAEPITVSSKWGYRYVAHWRPDAEVHEIKEHTLQALNRQYEESKSNLGDRLGVYQIHSATLESGVLEDGAVLDRLAEIRNSGTTIGLSTTGPIQAAVIRKAMTIERDGARLFGTVQSTWNLLEQSAGAALADAHEAGMGVLVKESMANGRLTERDPATISQLVNAIPGFSADAIAIAAALAQPWVDAVISGATTVAQLRSNLAALDIEPDSVHSLPPVTEEPEEYWSRRGSLAWT
jgi:aryl-alcohol dehydrogenase-like predicted oxidoreductase